VVVCLRIVFVVCRGFCVEEDRLLDKRLKILSGYWLHLKDFSKITINITVVFVFSVYVLSRMSLSSEAMHFSDATSRALGMCFEVGRFLVDRLFIATIK
jgi:hypothetical protein